MLFIVLLIVLLNADQMVMSPNIGAIEKDFNVDDAQIGLVGAVFTVVGAVVSLAWGYFADKYSRKRLLIYSILVGEIPCFMTAFSTSFSQLFFWRVLTGIGVGASFPIVFSLIGDMFDEVNRAKVAALMGAAISVGNILGMIVGGFVGPSFGWRLPFVLVSLPNVVLAFIALFVIKEPPRGAFEKGIGELVRAGYAYPKAPRLEDYAKLVSVKTNLLLFLQGIAGTIPWGAIPYFLVEFFRRERGLSVETATIIFLVFGVGNILGTIVGGWLGALLYKRSKPLVPIFCSLTTALGVWLTVLTFDYSNVANSGLYVLMVLGLLASLTDSLTGPNVKMMLLNVNEPQDRGRIFSIFNLTDSLGTGIGRWIGGLFSVSLGSLAAAMKVSAYFWLICSLFLFLLTFKFSRDVDSLESRMIALAQKLNK
ncbi:MFS transporter [Pseudothermotoga sp.]|nr:MFS transporter [Pseudothermotoga sp.]MCX7813345.1 MFS transporter [Pseudothermotoga sp.]MDW8139667.1 MFS transporter [Pseudothermotoga sp.]